MKLRTLNCGEVNAGYVNSSTREVQIGEHVIPTKIILKGASRLLRGGKPQNISFNGYKVKGSDFGYFVDELVAEGIRRE